MGGLESIVKFGINKDSEHFGQLALQPAIGPTSGFLRIRDWKRRG